MAKVRGKGTVAVRMGARRWWPLLSHSAAEEHQAGSVESLAEA